MARSRRLAIGLLTAALLGFARPAESLEVRGPRRGPKTEILARVARAAECVLTLPAFRRALAARREFSQSEDDGPAVLARFDQALRCRLSTYRRGGVFGHLMYWDRVDARHPPGTDVVQFNLNTFRSTDLPFLVGTAIHECAHRLGYTHRKNDRFRFPEIEATVPYQVGFLAREHAPSCLTAQAPASATTKAGG